MLPSTPPVEMAKVAVVASAATVTVAGTVTAEFPELRLITAPPVGAAAARVTVPVGEFPPTSEAGVVLTLAKSAGFTVTVVVAEVPLSDAVIVTNCGVATDSPVTVKVVEVVPAGTVTVAGTPAEVESELVRVTTSPDGPALPLRATVPLTVVPPTMVDEARPTELMPAVVTLSVAVELTPPEPAVMIAVTFVETAVVVMGKVAVVAPACTKTEFGTTVEGSLLDNETTFPLMGAA